MEISAIVRSSRLEHEVAVRTDATAQTLAIPRKPSGRGSAVNGGEFLMLASRPASATTHIVKPSGSASP